MATTLGSTGITFPDATTQTTAATGASTTLYDIGTYITGRPKNITAYAANATIAGTSLYNSSSNCWTDGTFWFTSGNNNNVSSVIVLVNTGTWRAMSPAFGVTTGAMGLWVRIS